MMAVPIQPGSALTFGDPVRLFAGPYTTLLSARTFDVSRDGSRFLMVKQTVAPTGSGHIAVVLNWTEELKRRVPAN